MNSLRGRLLAAFAYVLVLVLVALAVPFALSVSNRVESEVRAQTTAQAHAIAAGVAGRFDRPPALRQAVDAAARQVEGRVVVVDARGRLVADSAGDGLLGRAYGDRPELATALAGTVAQGRRRSDTLAEELVYAAVPVVDDGVRVGAVRVTRSAEPVDARVRRDLLALAGIAAGALLLGLALAWLLAGSLARPLRGLAASARRLGAGDLETRATVEGSAEQRETAAAFNEMAERLGRVLAAQREFVANASHQLRTPLTGLRLRLEAAGLKAADPALERDLAAAEREVERLARLVDALLALAREGAEPPPARPVDLAAEAKAAAARWRDEAEAQGRALDLAGDGPAWALASPEDVAIVLDNLVENALRHTPPGTEVRLEVGAGRLAVSDRGPGVPPDEAVRLFERFERGSAAGAPGTGLGLAIVRTLARRWGGEARLLARPGGGTTVEVTLPVAPRPAQARSPEVVA